MRILVLDPEFFSPEAVHALQRLGTVDCRSLSREELLKCIDTYEVLVLRFSQHLDADLIKKGTRLKVIATNTTGLDHIDTKAAHENGIKVISLQGEREFLKTVTATAEHTFALLLSLIRHVPEAYESVRRGKWDRNSFIGHELKGKTLGILGVGRVGEQVALRAEAFSMKVLGFDSERRLSNFTYVDSLSDLLGQSDIVSVHLPLNESTKQMIGSLEFNQMRGGAYFINTSRGSIVEEYALVEALRSGHLAGAAIDVLENERYSIEKNPLVSYAKTRSHLLITPHLGGCTWDSWQKTELFIAKKILDFLGLKREA